ncbi:hypothetical protein HCMG_00682 [Helicobacter canadensis MIT 98-5491]|nr:hypothetical protein HCMG_00682 [Helicobacter canadensis MIT 98-5491]
MKDTLARIYLKYNADSKIEQSILESNPILLIMPKFLESKLFAYLQYQR